MIPDSGSCCGKPTSGPVKETSLGYMTSSEHAVEIMDVFTFFLLYQIGLFGHKDSLHLTENDRTLTLCRGNQNLYHSLLG